MVGLNLLEVDINGVVKDLVVTQTSSFDVFDDMDFKQLLYLIDMLMVFFVISIELVPEIVERLPSKLTIGQRADDSQVPQAHAVQ